MCLEAEEHSLDDHGQLAGLVDRKVDEWIKDGWVTHRWQNLSKNFI